MEPRKSGGALEFYVIVYDVQCGVRRKELFTSGLLSELALSSYEFSEL
jgi:hypothetical protein